MENDQALPLGVEAQPPRGYTSDLFVPVHELELR